MCTVSLPEGTDAIHGTSLIGLCALVSSGICTPGYNPSSEGVRVT